MSRLAKNEFVADLAVFCLLVGIGVVGRLGTPVWHFTPIAAVGLFAGAYFSRRTVAMLVPVAAMAISNFWLPGYHNTAVMLSVYAMFAMPALVGPLLRRSRVRSTSVWAARLGLGAWGSSLAFYLVTNFAEWACTSNYEKTLAGLTHCYAAALPFYRQMLAGDTTYVALLFGAAMLAGVASPAVQAEPARVATRG